MAKQFAVICFSLLLITGCSVFKGDGSKSEDKQDFSDYEKGRVIDKTGLDGCTFIIKLESGKKLEPINLTNEYKKEQLPVWVQYEVKKGVASICMVGTMVEVIDIQKRSTEEED